MISEQFSWIEPKRLAVGPFPRGTHEAGFLSRMGITAILCLTKEREAKVDRDLHNRFVWERVPIPDGARGGVPTIAQFETSLGILQRWHQRRHAVYVHCLAGVGRSPSVCAAYLAYSHGWSLKEAIDRVKEKHAWAHPDPNQIRVMETLLAKLNSSAR